ncbi:hypothetical protein PAMA_002797 [Pampus argenteus]
MNEESEELQLLEKVQEAEEKEQQEVGKREEVHQQEEEQEEVQQQEAEEEEMHQEEELQTKEEPQQGEEVQHEKEEQQIMDMQQEVMQQEQEEVQQTEGVQPEEELQEEAQMGKMSQTEEQQNEEVQAEGVQWTEQVEEVQDFVDTLEQNHNNQVLIRLRGMLKGVLEQMDRGIVDLQELRSNLELAAVMLDAVYTDETKRLLDTEDELSDLQVESVPSEVRDWLACTFSRRMGMAKRRPEEKPRFRSIVHAVQAGIFVERMYRRTSNMAGLTYPPMALTALKATGDHALKFLVYDLLTRYDLINRFRIPVQALVQFVEALENGYSKHRNPYHNLIHAADVTQTAHFLMLHTGLMVGAGEPSRQRRLQADGRGGHEHPGQPEQQRLEGAESTGDRDGDVHRHVLSLPADQDHEKHPDTDTQGDKEVELGLPFSPLCDRKATMIAQSQIGFIDFIVEPTFSVLIDTTDKVIGPLIEEDRKARETGNRRSRYHY